MHQIVTSSHGETYTWTCSLKHCSFWTLIDIQILSIPVVKTFDKAVDCSWGTTDGEQSSKYSKWYVWKGTDDTDSVGIFYRGHDLNCHLTWRGMVDFLKSEHINCCFKYDWMLSKLTAMGLALGNTIDGTCWIIISWFRREYLSRLDLQSIRWGGTTNPMQINKHVAWVVSSLHKTCDDDVDP